jgi:predicted GTPase
MITERFGLDYKPVLISARTGAGLDKLRDRVLQIFGQKPA